MLLSTHVLALAVYIPLLAHCSPTVSSNYQLPPALGPQKLGLVRQNAITISSHSWELGTLAEALTELESPQLSVFALGSIPPPPHLGKGQARDVLSISEQYVYPSIPEAFSSRVVKPCANAALSATTCSVVAHKPPNSLPLIDGDGQVGDPASIGVSVLLRNWTLPYNASSPFSAAAKGQLDYLLYEAPRAPNGAISHRISEVQLWADFTYMAPPFIAYYGALQCGPTGDSLLQVAYEQVKLYRDVLFDESVGLWRHIALGNSTDPTHWGTGNGWAAAGALRVLATIQRSCEANSMKSQQDDLLRWVGETLDGVWKFQKANGTLLNYIDEPDSFSDTSSTALLAASTFRFASITGDRRNIPAAIRALKLVRDSVDSQGWLLNMVDPLKFSAPSGPGDHSPEGQSFVLLLEAAVSAWQMSYKT
ncbi:Six-hairpin glycosidase [Russula brevipes]|nr:Six-hairpin glycosidase [Russula brevipes]